MLKVENVDARYEHLQVLWGVSLEVHEGEFVGLIGPNGAGKTTLLKCICGLLKPVAGGIEFEGQRIEGMAPWSISRMGISGVLEDLHLFGRMSVHENLMLGAYAVRDKKQIRESLQRVHDLFPVLADRGSQAAGTLSGGELKMLALGRGLMSNPRILLVDEPSLGLAPKLAVSVFEALEQLKNSGMTILMAEQNVHTTLSITDRGYVLEQGNVVIHDASSALLDNAHLKEVYLV